jgi:IS4 transposase
MEHVLSQGAGFILRFKSKGFHLYDAKGERLDILPLLRRLKAFGSISIPCHYRLPDGTLRPVRIVAMKKDAKSIAASERRMLRKTSRKQEKAVQEDTVELSKYIVLATNLEYSNAQVLELYRARWQIEQLFFRLKSLFGYGDVPSSRDDTARAWFYGKLLLAAICEDILKRMSFPPGLDAILGDIVGAQLVERIMPDS